MAAGEECDEFDTWEEMEDSGLLDKKIEKLKAAMSTSIQKELKTGTSKSNTVVILQEDGRTRYVPPEPTVKILKRPSVISNSHNAGGDGFIINGDNSCKPKQPIKTLQQREIEYAEARLRILGEAQSPEEKPVLLERIRRIQNKIESVPEQFEQNMTSPTSNPLLSSTGPVLFTSTPVVMTSTQSQMNMLNGCNRGIVSGGISVIATNYVSANTGQYNSNNFSNQFQPQPSLLPPQPQQNVVGYSLLNHHYGNHYMLQNHYQYHMNNSSPSQNRSPSLSTSGTSAITTSIPNSIISMPISYNIVIRQPRGPDGTKGFHSRTLR